ncbi:hypothetical protein LTS18_011401 [Coniosporium uncinatum]|uniref:Uncharacterized protein n=1 Tax=Coniosporium uncinatum TaxID=93489 RepID=A0ACC3DKE1_9PEZI|nr:hypothetical protein LTS18_011401 [Coniosporium uncinatum]
MNGPSLSPHGQSQGPPGSSMSPRAYYQGSHAGTSSTSKSPSAYASSQNPSSGPPVGKFSRPNSGYANGKGHTPAYTGNAPYAIPGSNALQQSRPPQAAFPPHPKSPSSNPQTYRSPNQYQQTPYQKPYTYERPTPSQSNQQYVSPTKSSPSATPQINGYPQSRPRDPDVTPNTSFQHLPPSTGVQHRSPTSGQHSTELAQHRRTASGHPLKGSSPGFSPTKHDSPRPASSHSSPGRHLVPPKQLSPTSARVASPPGAPQLYQQRSASGSTLPGSSPGFSPTKHDSPRPPTSSGASSSPHTQSTPMVPPVALTPNASFDAKNLQPPVKQSGIERPPPVSGGPSSDAPTPALLSASETHQNGSNGAT